MSCLRSRTSSKQASCIPFTGRNSPKREREERERERERSRETRNNETCLAVLVLVALVLGVHLLLEPRGSPLQRHRLHLQAPKGDLDCGGRGSLR